MPIRRKSDATVEVKDCANLRNLRHEYLNQQIHEQRQGADPAHDSSAECWCCCTTCTDLGFRYEPRKGVWWAHGLNGELRLMGETCAGSPGSAGTSTS
jgi:hypothetical protein